MKSIVSMKQCFVAVLGIILLVAIPLVVIGEIIWHSFPVQHNNAENSPYGFTVLDTFTPRTVQRLKDLGVVWIRYQHNWRDIEPQPGMYNWRQLDAAVALANANGIHMTFPLQGAPTWAVQQMCMGIRFLPEPDTLANFARTVASRYNGRSGHGYIDAYEVGNEEYDIMLLDNNMMNFNLSLPCRTPAYYGPSLKLTYQSIKEVAKHAQVGMFGLWWENKTHITTFMEWLYKNGYGPYFDFANFHYYVCKSAPDDTTGQTPSFNAEWSIIHAVMEHYHDGQKAIWVTEVGWTTNSTWQKPECIVSPAQQARNVDYVLHAAMASHSIRRVFWYTIDRGDDGMSLTQTSGPLPAFYTMQRFVKKHPQW